MKRGFLAGVAVLAVLTPLISTLEITPAGASAPTLTFSAVFCEVPSGQQLPTPCLASNNGPGQAFAIVLSWTNTAGTSVSTYDTIGSTPHSGNANDHENIPVSNGGDYKYTLESTVMGIAYYANTSVVVPDLAPASVAAYPDGSSGNNIEVDPFPNSSSNYLDIKTGNQAGFSWTTPNAPPWDPSGPLVSEVAVNPGIFATWNVATCQSQSPPCYPIPSSAFANSANSVNYAVRTCVNSASTFCGPSVPVTANFTGAKFQGGARQYVQVGSNASVDWQSPAGQVTPGNFWEVASPAINNGTPVVVQPSTSYSVPTTTAGLENVYLLTCDLITFTQATCGGSMTMGSVNIQGLQQGQQAGTISGLPSGPTLESAGAQVATITNGPTHTPVRAPAGGILVPLVSNGSTVTQGENIVEVSTTEQQIVVGSNSTFTPATFTYQPWTSAFSSTSSKVYSVNDEPGVGKPTKSATDANGNVFWEGEFNTAIGEVNTQTSVPPSSFQIPVANIGGAPIPPQSNPFSLDPLFSGPTVNDALGEGTIYADGKIWAIEGGGFGYPNLGAPSNHSRIVSFDPTLGTLDDSIPGNFRKSFCVYSVPGNNNEIYDLTWDGKYIWYTDPGNKTIDWFDPDRLKTTCDTMLDYSKLNPDNSVVGAHQVCPINSPDCINQTPAFSASTIQSCPSGDSAALKITADPNGHQIWYDGFGGALGEITYNRTTGVVTSRQQWDCKTSPTYPIPAEGEGNAIAWNMVADATNVYWVQSSDTELIKFNKLTQTFNAIPLPMGSRDIILSLGILNGDLYFVDQGGWGSTGVLGYVNTTSWNAGNPSGAIYTGLSSFNAANNAQLGPSAFDGISFIATTGGIAMTDYGRGQIYVLHP
jgi:hypothetical protein